MSHTESPSSSSESPSGRTVAAATEAGRFTVRWGRLAIAASALVFLMVAMVTSVLAVAGLVSSLIPVFALLLGVAGVGTLRFLALRDRRRRADAAPAVAARPEAPAEKAAPRAERPTKLFDAEDSAPGAKENDDDGASEPAAKFTAAELRAAALAVAAEAGDPTVGTGAPWQPVEVPKPTYVEAPKAERQEPAPLDLPEAPKPQSKTPLKNGATAPKVEATAPRMNLDDILQRRRA